MKARAEVEAGLLLKPIVRELHLEKFESGIISLADVLPIESERGGGAVYSIFPFTLDFLPTPNFCFSVF